MNFKNLKKAIACFSAGLFVFVNVLTMNVASAQTFQDVPTDHWSYDFVEEGVTIGLFDSGDYFRPNDNINRAEMAKIAVKLAEYAGIVPGIDTDGVTMPTDVPADSWFAPYVATGIKYGLFEGYKDANGNLTGYFGPADNVTRAQAAKVFTNAAGVPDATTPSAPFTDLEDGAWYVTYVTTAYNQSIIDGYKDASGNLTGKFGPNDPLTRAQLAKVSINSLNPHEREDTNSNDNTNGSTTKKGTLSVELSDDTPPAANIPQDAPSVAYTELVFEAGSDSAVEVTSVKITRTGLGQRQDFDRIWIEKDGVRISSRASINSDNTATLTFSTPLSINAGGSVKVVIYAQMSGANQNTYNALGINSEDDVECTAKNVDGDFPIAGEEMQTTNVNVGNVLVDSTGTDYTRKVGENEVIVGNFTLEVNGEDAHLQKITIYIFSLLISLLGYYIKF